MQISSLTSEFCFRSLMLLDSALKCFFPKVALMFILSMESVRFSCSWVFLLWCVCFEAVSVTPLMKAQNWLHFDCTFRAHVLLRSSCLCPAEVFADSYDGASLLMGFLILPSKFCFLWETVSNKVAPFFITYYPLPACIKWWLFVGLVFSLASQCRVYFLFL